MSQPLPTYVLPAVLRTSTKQGSLAPVWTSASTLASPLRLTVGPSRRCRIIAADTSRRDEKNRRVPPNSTAFVPSNPSDSVAGDDAKTLGDDESPVPDESGNDSDSGRHDDSSGSGGSGGNGSGGGGDSGGSNDGDRSEDPQPNNESARAVSLASCSNDRLKPWFSSVSTAVSATASSASSFTSSVVSILLKNVPPPVLVALISLFSTLTGSRVKARRDAAAAERARMEAARKHKLEVERGLRKTYEEFASPLLKASAKLAERLHMLVAGDWDGVEAVEGEENLSPLYSAFLLGRFFAHVGILKRERSNLDYGFPSADRILANILGRVQGVLCANDRLLLHLQRTEHFFKPAPGDKPLRAGPLKLSPRAQTVLGELMLKRAWYGRAVGDCALPSTAGERVPGHGPKAVLSFLEFSRLYARDEDMRRWFEPVVREFTALEEHTRSTSADARRNDKVGARAYFLQSALLDLIEFFDPLPHPSSIPLYQRRRLSLGATSYREEQRSPLSLRLLYGELARFRDYRDYGGERRERLAVPHVVEVFVTGKCNLGDPRVETVERGNCPYSHRVLIALREMGIPHKVIPVALDSRPVWFYLLHPWERTPVIYHDGNVVSESGNIVGYLLQKFPNAQPLASANKLKLAVGTDSFTRFHTHFVQWVRGDGNAQKKMETELRKLNCTLQEAQAKNEGAPFFGGERFSREDTALVPCLHNMEVAARRLKGWKFPDDLTAVRRYLDEARQVPSFEDSGAKEEEVVRMFKDMKRERWELAGMQLADMPE